MATAHQPAIAQHSTNRLGVVRLAATIGVAAGLIFVLCWIGAYLSFASATHAYISLFTDAEAQSIRALVEGALWSLVFGLLSGGLIAALYNLFAGLDRR